MKTKSTLFLILFGLSISTIACKKCQTCTYTATGGETEVCREGAYRTPQLYDAYIQSLESNGYDCN
jgi:hypothetical protein